MAGKLKPSSELKEASYTVNSYRFWTYSPQCPLFDGATTGWQGGGAAYWWDDDNHVDLTINEKCNIYKLSQYEYNDDSHQIPLVLMKYEKEQWVDVSDKYPQVINKAPTTWTKTITSLPKGRYKFMPGKNRLDAEWFIEKASEYCLYLQGSTVYGMQEMEDSYPGKISK